MPSSIHIESITLVFYIAISMAITFIIIFLLNHPLKSLPKSLVMVGAISIIIYVIHEMIIDNVYVSNYDDFILNVAVFNVLVIFFSLFVLFQLRKLLMKPSIRVIISSTIALCFFIMHYSSIMVMNFHLTSQKQVQLRFLSEEKIMHLTNFYLIILIFLAMISLFIKLFDLYIDYRDKYFNKNTLLPNSVSFEKACVKNNFKQLAILKFTLRSPQNLDIEKLMTVHLVIKQCILQHKSSQMKVFQLERNVYVIANTVSEPQFDQQIHTIFQQLERHLNSLEHYSIQVTCGIHLGNGQSTCSTLFKEAQTIFNDERLQTQTNIVIFDPQKHKLSLDTIILKDIFRAIRENEVYLQYQPKITANTNKLHSFEALIRWSHPELGMISPAIFIPILEKNHLMKPLTEWIINEASRQIAIWKKEHFPISHVSINIPAFLVTSPILLAKLNEITKKHQINPSEIELEITETSLIENIHDAIHSLEQIRENGYLIALDDFGTGLSSLSYLKLLPIHTLKIDKSFVDGVPFNQKDAAILKNILALGTSLSLEVIVEGVETKEQHAFICKHCSNPIIQGYYYSKPLSIGQIPSFLNVHNISN